MKIQLISLNNQNKESNILNFKTPKKWLYLKNGLRSPLLKTGFY